MATNLKGKGRFVSIMFLHGEKIAIGIVAVIALWFVYRAFKLPRLGADFQAEKLQSEITRTNSEIKNFTWDQAVANHPDKVKKAQPIESKGDLNVKVADYVPRDSAGKPNLAFDNPIVAPVILRADPVMLNAEDVRATGGSGLFAFVDEKIRQQQQLKAIETAKEAERKAAEKAKRDAAKAKEASGRRSSPEAVTELLDPTHPKRHLITGSVRPTGNALQGGERIERAYWACVVAKVPIREQLKLFQDALEKARGNTNPEHDFPSYVGFYVERAEVLPGKELAWAAVPLYDGQRQSITQNKPLTTAPSHAVAKTANGTGAFDKLLVAAGQFWAGGATQDPVDSRYAESPLTLPLPPLVGREWGAEASHPDIPWGPNTPPLEQENQQVTPDVTTPQPGANGGEFGSGPGTTTQAGPAVNPGFGGAAPGGAYGRSRAMGPEGGMGPNNRVMAAGPEGGMGPGSGMRSGAGPGQVAGQHTSLPKGVDYYLLRFFDFSVEPGKKYKYRVKLVVNDPNFGMLQTDLDPAVLDRQAKEAQVARAKKIDKPWFRIVDKWSDPSPAVGIPMAGNVRLAEAKIPAAPTDEPTVKMLVEAFDVDSAGTLIQGSAEKDFRRGYVANWIGDARYQPDPTMVDTQSNFKFATGMTLLDVDGGGKLSRDMTYPSRILVMGPAGELYIRNDTDDKPYVQTFHAIFDETTEKHGKPAGGPEGGPGPGPRRPTKR